MSKTKKIVVIVAPVIFICLLSGFILYNVIVGKIGNYETWRIVCAISGFLITNLLTYVLIVKIKNP